MNTIKKWFIDHTQTFIFALVLLISGYYMYLTNVTQLFSISETYCVSDEYSTVVIKFDGTTMSTYLLNPDLDTIATRTDYLVRYRKYNKDFLGNFWSNEGIEPFALRGSDIAGLLDTKCVSSVIWTYDEDPIFYNQNDILSLEEENDISYSFYSRFSLKGYVLRVIDYFPLDLQKVEELPSVENEIIRLMDSLCPPDFD